ncbi:MAG: LysM peptidoglycan-binding domain-containing protein [Candidatus Omnitrophica bacterium]|nr:LysM peptidoglycan-binding domain-containing protein [Candidatus Omnitrophota bacterium]
MRWKRLAAVVLIHTFLCLDIPDGWAGHQAASCLAPRLSIQAPEVAQMLGQAPAAFPLSSYSRTIPLRNVPRLAGQSDVLYGGVAIRFRYDFCVALAERIRNVINEQPAADNVQTIMLVFGYLLPQNYWKKEYAEWRGIYENVRRRLAGDYQRRAVSADLVPLLERLKAMIVDDEYSTSTIKAMIVASLQGMDAAIAALSAAQRSFLEGHPVQFVVNNPVLLSRHDSAAAIEINPLLFIDYDTGNTASVQVLRNFVLRHEIARRRMALDERISQRETASIIQDMVAVALDFDRFERGSVQFRQNLYRGLKSAGARRSAYLFQRLRHEPDARRRFVLIYRALTQWENPAAEAAVVDAALDLYARITPGDSDATVEETSPDTEQRADEPAEQPVPESVPELFSGQDSTAQTPWEIRVKVPPAVERGADHNAPLVVAGDTIIGYPDDTEVLSIVASQELVLQPGTGSNYQPVTYEVERPQGNSEEYLQRIKDASERLAQRLDHAEGNYIQEGLELFFGEIWPEFLTARAAQAANVVFAKVVIDDLQLFEIKDDRADIFVKYMLELIKLSGDPQSNNQKIQALAKRLRGNVFLRENNIYLFVEVLKRSLPGTEKPEYFLSSVAHRIDGVYRRAPESDPVLLLGDRIDDVNQRLPAGLGFVFFGDTHGVVVKKRVDAETIVLLLPYLEDKPVESIGGSVHPEIHQTLREFLLLDYPDHPHGEQRQQVFAVRHRLAANHESQHLSDQRSTLWGTGTATSERIKQEVSAYLAQIYDCEHPFAAIADIAMLYLSFYREGFFRFFRDPQGIYLSASYTILWELAQKWEISITSEELQHKPVSSVNTLLRALQERLAQGSLSREHVQADARSLRDDLIKWCMYQAPQLAMPPQSEKTTGDRSDGNNSGDTAISGTFASRDAVFSRFMQWLISAVKVFWQKIPFSARQYVPVVMWLIMGLYVFGMGLYLIIDLYRQRGDEHPWREQFQRRQPAERAVNGQPQPRPYAAPEVLPQSPTTTVLEEPAASPAAPAQPAEIEPFAVFHTVSPGESLSVIADQVYGMHRRPLLQALARINNLAPLPKDLKAYHHISPGRELSVPAEIVLEHTVRSRDTLSTIARRYYGRTGAPTIQRLQADNNLPDTTIKRGTVLKIIYRRVGIADQRSLSLPDVRIVNGRLYILGAEGLVPFRRIVNPLNQRADVSI